MPTIVPVGVAFRRLRSRLLQTLLLGLAVAGASSLLGTATLLAARAQERAVSPELAALEAPERSLQIRYRVQPQQDTQLGRPAEPGALGPLVALALRPFADVTERPRSLRIWNAIAPRDESGIRIVAPGETAFEEVTVLSGRLPRACAAAACEALALSPGFRVGDRVPLEAGAVAVVTGRGSLGPKALPDVSALGRRALLMQEPTGALGEVLAGTGSGVLVTAVLRPEAVHGYDLERLGRQLRETVIRLERLDPFLRASAPIERLEALANRSEVARERLLLIAGQGAALVLAFAAFAARARREDSLRLEEQLRTFGASRAQIAVARAVEALVPSAGGAILAVGGVWLAVLLVASRDDLPARWIDLAFPGFTLAAMLVLGIVAAAVLYAAGAPRPRRFGFGVLEAAGLTALAISVWQVASTGGLAPADVARGGASPLLLLTPGLALLACGVLLLRVLPGAFRFAERVSRRAPESIRLALLTTARNPAQAAAATTFLAVALGGALFSLSYRETLDAQARDEAAFRAGAQWRVLETGEELEFNQANTADVSPLTRYSRVTNEAPTPALRLEATVQGPSGTTPVEVIALPGRRLDDVLGWRENFSSVPRTEIERRLRSRTVELTGLRLAEDVRAIRVTMRSRADLDRFAILHFLLRGQKFEQLPLRGLAARWERHAVDVPASFAGAQLVAVQFPTVASTGQPDDGYIDVGGLEQLTRGGWSRLPALSNWVAARSSPGSPEGTSEPMSFGPDGHGAGLRYSLAFTFLPFVRPPLDIPETLPALVSGPLAASAVDRRLTLNLPVGAELTIEPVAAARFFPTAGREPSRFVVLDYATLFAALNADFPGQASPMEAWFFEPQPPGFVSLLDRPPFRLATAVGAAELETKLRNDPLAAGARTVFLISGLAGAALALLGLVFAVRSSLAAERPLQAEYEALGVAPSTLARSVQIRLGALCVFGIVAAVLGSLVAVTFVAAYVAVTGAAARPLPPIEAELAWGFGASLIAAVGVGALLGAGMLARRSFRESAASRLRA
jgi:hypothetical protein